MNRRNFLALFGAAVAGIALDQAIPFNRVWSFPQNIVVPDSTLAIAPLSPFFAIGDIVSIGNFPDLRDRLFKVSALLENGRAHLFEIKGHKNLLLDCTQWSIADCPQKMLTPAFPPATSRPSTS
jgi:hypothetical protein